MNRLEAVTYRIPDFSSSRRMTGDDAGMAESLVRITDAALPIPEFRRALQGLKRVGDDASYWRTFWFPLGDRPANVVEALVPLLRRRLPPAQKRLVGVEWWIGRMRTHDVPLDFHHDRDLKLFEETGELRHPVWSSVLFFTQVKGGSLFVTNQQLVQRRGELVLSPAEPTAFGRAQPKPNRYAVFPGELFHGVLDARDQVPDEPLPEREGELRLSLVVNWWDEPPRGVKSWAASRAYRALSLAGD